MEFDWDSFNLEHIAQHGIRSEEAESALRGATMYVESRKRNGEERLTRIGRSSTGRILYLVTVERNGKTRVVTAFIASKRFRIQYGIRF